MQQERLALLRQEMEKRGIFAYLVPTADFHESEYVGEHFKARKFLTGFSGSAGTAVVTLTEAGLWTDARYFLQAEAQLAGSSITLYRMGEEGVPTIHQYLEQVLPEGAVLGFDGRVVNGAWGKELEALVAAKGGALAAEEDLVGLIWADRPPLPHTPVYLLGEAYTGQSTASKLAEVRAKMAEAGASLHLMTSLYDIAWLLNLRGSDIDYVPVILSYLMLTEQTCVWFVQEQVVDDTLRAYLTANGITTRPYEDFYDAVKAISPNETLLMDTSVANYRVCGNLPEGIRLIDAPDPTVLMKAIKNPVQQENLRRAHLKDAVAMCKFMYWLKTNVGKIPMTELSVSDYLESLRAAQEGYISLSFDTICGYAAHGAIVHYAATEESNIPLAAEGLLLVDSGGHYLEGTTDITRTFALGPVTEEMKADFTRVCRANLNLAAARFLHGCTGQNLDILARTPLWEAALDYKHGTGHGVGYVLNVHEGPNAFRWRSTAVPAAVLEPGMVTTDEPGLYVAGQYGIRTENELLCRLDVKNEFGQFLSFEELTYVPIDLDALAPEQMSQKERDWLNAYHAMVYEKVAPLLTPEEADWLKVYTRAI
jgi:Xaa-Pro aminopeptidase